MSPLELGLAVSSLTTDLILGADNPGEPFTVLMKPNFDTACWSFLPPHRVYIGENCLSRAKAGLTFEQLERYLDSFFRHEISHLRWTERNLIKVNQVLKKESIPFSLFNLFEDARVEHKERDRSAKLFNWSEFELIEVPVPGQESRPITELFLLIQLENTQRELRQPDVVTFYDRAINASTSLALVPIIKEWMVQFGADVPPARFAEELQTSFKLQSNANALEDFDQGTSTPGKPKKPAGPIIPSKETGPTEFLDSELHDVDFARAERLAKKFLGLFGSRSVTTRSEEPSSRISSRHLELGRPFYKRKSLITSVAKKLCLIIDCSGSMEDQPIEDAVVLAWALSFLASLGKIKGCLILSAMDGRRAISEVFEFPLTKDMVQRIHAFGSGEGLNAAILDNHAKLADADMVFVKTDAEIGDEPVNKALVRKKGITVCGLYSGGVGNAEKMAEHFTQFFIRDSLESLIDALLKSRLA